MAKKKILLIEDDPLMSRMYERLFTIHDYDIAVDLDSQSGVEQAKTLKPDLILLDIMMPNMNGIEALKVLKGDEVTKSIPVVMITNVEDHATKKQAEELGADGYLVKSRYDPDETVEYVAKKLKG
jgi:twitching motility two-component system response regulator PilH